MSKATIPKQNTNSPDRESIMRLVKNEDILILSADKGKATVIMDKEEYNSTCNNMVSDIKVYQQLKYAKTNNTSNQGPID